MLLKKIKQKGDYTVVCNIVLDEMSIRIHTDWDGTIMHGFVDIDTNIEI